MALNLNGLLIDKNFIDLDAKLKSGNIFRALNVDGSERIHTRFLAYLLDPNETHGLSDAFLESFLLNTWMALDLDHMITDLDLDMASVFCEWLGSEAKTDSNRIDILIKIPYKKDPKRIYVVAIEGKVKAKLRKNQLSDYTKKLDEAGFSKKDMLCLFLVKNEEESELPEWSLVYWQELILSALRTTNERYRNLVSPKIASALEDYVEIISEWAIEEDPLVNGFLEALVEFKPVVNSQEAKLYLEAKHSLAYRALARYLTADERSTIKAAFNKWAKDKDLVVADSSKSYLRFYPKTKRYPFRTDLTQSWTSQNVPILFEIHVTKPAKGDVVKSRVSLVMGPLDSHYKKARADLVLQLRENIATDSGGWSATRKSIGEEHARVFGYPKNSEKIDVSDPEKIFDKYLAAATKIVDQINEIVNESFLKLNAIQ